MRQGERERKEGENGIVDRHTNSMSTEPSLDYMHSITASGAEYSTRP